jgi:hypothetical protein
MHGLAELGWRYVMEPTSNTPIEAAAVALATAVALPMTATDDETLTLVCELARIARHLGELTAAARDRWAAWGTVTPHLQQAEALATYAFNTTRADATIVRLAATGTAQPAA